MRFLLQRIIRVYQRTLSPDHGWFQAYFPHGFCRYYPSCSQYTYEVIGEQGVLRGFPEALWRIVRCNPFSRGGVDRIRSHNQ